MTQADQINALLRLIDAIVDSVKVAGRKGAPGGVLYAALMAHGCTLQQFETLMETLVAASRLHRKGHLYFAPEG